MTDHGAISRAALKLYYAVEAEGLHGHGIAIGKESHFCPVCRALTELFLAFDMKEIRGKMYPADFSEEEINDMLIDLMCGIPDPYKDSHKGN